MSGYPADELAALTHRSIHTVRSQIKAVLTKLEVRTQLAAVAMAHRSGDFSWVRESVSTFINLGDDDVGGHPT